MTDEMKPDLRLRIRVMLTVYADVDIDVFNKESAQGAYVKTEIPEKSMMVSFYGGFSDEHRASLHPDVQKFLTTQCAHTVAGIAEQKLGAKLNVRGAPQPNDAPNMGPGNA